MELYDIFLCSMQKHVFHAHVPIAKTRKIICVDLHNTGQIVEAEEIGPCPEVLTVYILRAAWAGDKGESWDN